MNELMKQLGQFFILGFHGSEPPTVLKDFISEEQVGGIILFADNCETHQATRELISTVRGYLNRFNPFIAIDQEGGRVCRIKGAPAEYPSAWSFGINNDQEHFREQYSRSALFMESLGINLNLAPVADIFLNEDNSCLVDRCFSEKPEVVAEFVKIAVQTSSQSGLLSCLKHFPGLGAAAIDPHQQISIIDVDSMTWDKRERLPFIAGIEAGADMIMTTHAQMPRLGNDIVTYSDHIVRTMIRQNLSFDGPIITDDLTMSGAGNSANIGERSVRAFMAGHDLLLFGQDYEQAIRAYDYFCDACHHGEIPLKRLRSALSRVSGLKFKLQKSAIL